MDISNKYTIYVSTARGTLVYTNCKQNEKFKYELPEKPSEITAMDWGRNENEIILGTKDGLLKIYDASLNKYIESIVISDNVPITGIGSVNNLIVTGNAKGFVNLWTKKKIQSFSLNLDDKGTLDCLVCNKNRSGLGTGGESNDFKLWDLETQKCIFKAKSLGHDELNLPLPTSIRGISFFPSDSELSACVTKEGYVLLYDDRAQRRPVVKFIEPKASYTTIATTFRDRQCVVGTTRGYMQLIDLRAPGKCIKTFKSFTGSVTSIICDPLEPIVFSTCLDRYLRVHNLDTKELIYKEYMKQNLMKLVVKPYIKEESDTEQKGEGNVSDVEYEELFDNMETVYEGAKRENLDNKKRKRELRKVVIDEIKQGKGNKMSKKKKRDIEIK